MKILICFGTRPEAIKMAPICLELAKQQVSFKVCVTGQHREMLDQVLEFFEITPDYDLNLMKPNQSLNELSSRILKEMGAIFKKHSFDLVLVHGDTTTSMMASLAAFHSGVKVGHVEAGLRTYNKLSPFPEELNRQLTTRIADFHFAPTKKAVSNLINEDVNKESIIITGNTVIDALFFTLKKLKNNFKTNDIVKLQKQLNFSKKIILVTGHRRESFGKGFENVSSALLEISKREDIELVYPVHLNPNVQKPVNKLLNGKSNIHLIPPLDYPSFVWLMNKSSLIISDSGGIQEEAPSLNIPVLVTRDTTERYEGVAMNCSILVGTNKTKIVKEAHKILNTTKKQVFKNPYGDGKASEIIVNYICKLLLNNSSE